MFTNLRPVTVDHRVCGGRRAVPGSGGRGMAGGKGYTTAAWRMGWGVVGETPKARLENPSTTTLAYSRPSPSSAMAPQLCERTDGALS